MADRWLYIHAGAAHGPVDLEKLTQMAAIGKLLPTDQVWPAGEDRRQAVEAQALLQIESFPRVQVKTPETPASPPQPASATPDWLSDVATSSEPALASPPLAAPVVEVVNEVVDVELVDEVPVEVVDEGTALTASPKPPRHSKQSIPVAKRKAPPPPTNRPARDEADDPDEPTFHFKRRDLLMFGGGVIGLGLAVAAGLFFAKLSQRATDDEPPKNGGDEKP